MIVFFYGLTGFAATYSQFVWTSNATPATEAVRGGILIVTPSVIPVTRYARLFLNSLQIAGWLSRIYILILVLRPFISRDRLDAPKEDIDRIFRVCGDRPVSAFAVQRDKHHLLVAHGQGLVAYATKGSAAFACGDPLVPDELFAVALEDYSRHCQRHGWTPCVYLAAEHRLPAYQALKYQSIRVAEEALVNLDAFAAPSEISRLDIIHRYERSAGADPLIDEQLEEVTEDWLELRHMREMGFTAGQFSLEHISQGPVFILGNRYRVEAFSAWLLYKNGKAAVLDVLRQRRYTSEEMVKALVAESLRLLKESGFVEASLTAAAINREQIETFRPLWETRYLVHPRGANVSKIMKALTALEPRRSGHIL
jgi:phosphatidylglycerol lysyltransferase